MRSWDWRDPSSPIFIATTYTRSGWPTVVLSPRAVLYCYYVTSHRKNNPDGLVDRNGDPTHPGPVMAELVIGLEYLGMWPDLNVYRSGDGGSDFRVRGLFQTTTIDAKCHMSVFHPAYMYTREAQLFNHDIRVQAALSSPTSILIYGYMTQGDFLNPQNPCRIYPLRFNGYEFDHIGMRVEHLLAIEDLLAFVRNYRSNHLYRSTLPGIAIRTLSRYEDFDPIIEFGEERAENLVKKLKLV